MQLLKHKSAWGFGIIILSILLSGRAAANTPFARLAPPNNVSVEVGANAIRVRWDASPDEAGNYELAGYNVYFGVESLILLSPDKLPEAVQFGRRARACVVRGLENGRRYFFQVRARALDGSISAASQPEQIAAPQLDAANHALTMYDAEAATNANISAYGWNRENGQDIAGYRNATQHGKYVDILMMESSVAKGQSLFVSPSEADFTHRWPYRNRTLIAEVGTNWVVADSLLPAKFATTATIKSGHVYILQTHDHYYIKLRVDSIAEVHLPFTQQRDASRNRITFTYTSQLGQSSSDFLTAKP